MSLLEHAQNRERGVRVKRYMPRVLHFSAFIIIVIIIIVVVVVVVVVVVIMYKEN